VLPPKSLGGVIGRSRGGARGGERLDSLFAAGMLGATESSRGGGSASGTLSGAPILSEDHAYPPRLAVDQSGNAVFVWSRTDWDTGIDVVEARARSATGTLSPTQLLSAPGQDAGIGDVAVDPSGNAMVVWGSPDQTTSCPSSPPESPGCMRIRARSRSAAGALGTTQTLSAAGQDALSPRIKIDQSGDAVAVWRRFGGASWRIQAAIGP
jgi:hypothetical protein